MGLLADVFSYGDTLKRRLGGLLSDPAGTVDLGVRRFAEDQNSLLQLMDQSGYTPGAQSVLQTPQDKQVARNELAKKALETYGGLLGATVWHGSPHKFDKFDSSKIGTGEGAQAYGHGLYLAESPDVAKTYAIDQRGQSAGDMAERYLKNFGNKESALQAAEARLAKVTEEFKPEFVQPYRDAVEMLRTGNIEKGGLYKVDLPDEHIAKMLDWDKPLLEQQSLLKSVPEFAEANQAVFGHPISTSEPLADMAYQTLSKHLGGADKAADLLRKRGIPGIRYLDGGSRDAGAGSSNFVVFPGNEGLLKILERNGSPIP